VPIGIKTDSLVFKCRVHKFCNRRTDGQRENITPPPVSLTWRSRINKIETERREFNIFVCLFVCLFVFAHVQTVIAVCWGG